MRKLCLFALVALMLVSLFGCGSGAKTTTEASTAEVTNAPATSAEASTAAAKEPFKVGYVNSSDTDVFDVMRKTALKGLVDPAEFDITYNDPNNDIQAQLGMVDNMIAKKVNLIILVPVDGKGAIPAVEAANKAGIPVICLGINALGGDFIFVGSKHYDSGHMQGEYLAKVLPKNAKVLYMEGSPGYDHTTLRKQGFWDALKEAGRTDVVSVASQTGNYDKAQGMALMENWIQAHGKDGFDAVVCANDQMALGAIEAMKTAGITKGSKMVSGIDATQEACQAIVDGWMTSTIKQDADGQAKQCLEVMKKIAAGETVEKEYFVGYGDVNPDTVKNFIE